MEREPKEKSKKVFKGKKLSESKEIAPIFRDNRPESAVQRQIQEMANTPKESAIPIQQKAYNTGLPNQLKSGIENLSGYSMDDVKVHYNSPKPAQLQAHAYAQGTDIHIASGQEKHLPHEAWHVVQQKQGRVKPTMQLKGKVNINDDARLEREADVMGGKAKSHNSSLNDRKKIGERTNSIQRAKNVHEMGVDKFNYHDILKWDGKEPGYVNNVNFKIDKSIFVMSATWKYNENKEKYMEVLYNPDHVSHMTPQARYFTILHELGHLYYEHPGNNHFESKINEIQADDAAVVNAITLHPLESMLIFRDIRNFIKLMEEKGYKGGGSHPENPEREQRILKLQALIMKYSTVKVHIESNFIVKDILYEFLNKFGKELLIEEKDVKTFTAQNGKFGYINGKGEIKLGEYLKWLLKFASLKNHLPSLRQSFEWILRPVEVQNKYKDKI
jgi:hypothetical protein